MSAAEFRRGFDVASASCRWLLEHRLEADATYFASQPSGVLLIIAGHAEQAYRARL